MLRRSLLLILLLSACLSAQMPKGIYAWWGRPEIIKDLNLTAAQRQQIRATVQQYRAHLLNVRSEVDHADQELAEQFDREPIDPNKANEAIERLVDARSDLTRTLTQLSLKLRLVLTEQQWQELQRRRPGQAPADATARSAGAKIIRTSRRPLLQPRSVHLIDFRRQHEVALGQSANLVRVDLHVHLAPGQAQIRMVAFLFSHRAHAIHKIEPRFEIGERKTFRDVVLLDDLPVGQLFGKRRQLRALQRRNAAAARHAMFLGKLRHGYEVQSLQRPRMTTSQ